MTIQEERLQWKHDAAMINNHVDNMIDVLQQDANAVPVAYMAVDLVYRPYIQWLHSAQIANIDATQTRNSAIHLVNMMIIEMASRMNSREDGLNSAIEWVEEFLEMLSQEVDEDFKLLLQRKWPNENQR